MVQSVLKWTIPASVRSGSRTDMLTASRDTLCVDTEPVPAFGLFAYAGDWYSSAMRFWAYSPPEGRDARLHPVFRSRRYRLPTVVELMRPARLSEACHGPAAWDAAEAAHTKT